MRLYRCRALLTTFAAASFLTVPALAQTTPRMVANPICPDNTAFFNPDQGADIIVPPGFRVSVFASGLNFPTGIAFRGDAQNFQVYVLESGHGLPSRDSSREESTTTLT